MLTRVQYNKVQRHLSGGIESEDGLKNTTATPPPASSSNIWSMVFLTSGPARYLASSSTMGKTSLCIISGICPRRFSSRELHTVFIAFRTIHCQELTRIVKMRTKVHVTGNYLIFFSALRFGSTFSSSCYATPAQRHTKGTRLFLLGFFLFSEKGFRFQFLS